MLSQALGESPVHSQSHTCTGATLVPGESTKESLYGDSWEEKRKSPPLQHQPRGSLNQTSIRQHLPETARPPARSQGDGWSQVPDEETGSETVVVQFPPSTNHTHSNKNNNTGYLRGLLHATRTVTLLIPFIPPTSHGGKLLLALVVVRNDGPQWWPWPNPQSR